MLGRGVERGSPRLMLAANESLLDEVRSGGPAIVRWYVVDAPALVLGFAQRLRATDLVDAERCRATGVEMLERRAGGGLVLLDESMLCLAVALPLPHQLVPADLTESYRWLGEALASGLRARGIGSARCLEVAEARLGAAELAASDGQVSRLLGATCYGVPSPHEVVVGTAKLAGLAQVRRRHAALFQAGILLRDQSPLAALVRVPDEAARAGLCRALAERTVGLDSLLACALGPAQIVRAVGPYLEASISSRAVADAAVSWVDEDARPDAPPRALPPVAIPPSRAGTSGAAPDHQDRPRAAQDRST
jgi:lipoate-protein ligase A